MDSDGSIEFNYQVCPKCGREMNVLKNYGSPGEYSCARCRIGVSKPDLTHVIRVFAEWDGLSELPSKLMDLQSVPRGFTIFIKDDNTGDPHGGLWGPELVFAITYVVGQASSVVSSMLASWLYDRFRHAEPDRVFIENIAVEIDKDKIRLVIERKLEEKGK